MAAETAERPSATRHMLEMAALYVRRQGPMGTQKAEALRAAYCAGFVEGLWTEKRRGEREVVGDGR